MISGPDFSAMNATLQTLYSRSLMDVQQAASSPQASPGASKQNAPPMPVAFPAPPPAAQPALPTEGRAGPDHKGTQGSDNAATTPTIPTYGATAVTAPNGTLGASLDLFA